MATKKRKSTRISRKQKSASRKKKNSKIYIPASRIILLCTIVIAVCMLLLFVTSINPNAFSDLASKEKEAPSITSRFIDPAEEKSEKNKSDVSKQNEKKEQQKSTKSLDNTISSSKKETKSTEKSNSKKEEKVTQKNTETQAQKTQSSKKTSDEKQPDSTQNESTKNETKINESASKQEEKLSTFNFPKAVNNAQLVFVFDDGGQNIAHLEKFLELPFPITVAVLPQLQYSKQSAKRVREAGKELILHQPMQAINSNINPGPGAITPNMSEKEIISTLFYNINEIAPIAGMNNHEGSAITADAQKMEIILKLASENGIYFLDSRTNVNTQVPYVAKELGYSYYERNIFLDNEKTKENIISELKKGIAIANKNGVAIMIGHIWSADVLPNILKEAYPELKEKGYLIKTVSECNGRK